MCVLFHRMSIDIDIPFKFSSTGNKFYDYVIPWSQQTSIYHISAPL